MRGTKGKKVYGYLSAGTKKLVDAIVDDLASDSRIAELYDLWYQQRERIIQTYSSHLPERVPLSQNEEFKAVRNAVVKAAVGIEYQKGIQTEDYKRARELLYGTDDAV